MLRQIGAVTAYNFRTWKRNPRIIVTFLLAFVLCFLLSDKAVKFAIECGTSMQLVEAFVWTFGDSNSILLASLFLVLLFSDMPFLGAGVPYYLSRIDRKTWLFGQIVYVCAATTIYMLFILFSTSLICIGNSYSANMWSKTAAILGYSGAGEAVALPALVKTLEMSTPYESMEVIFFLMLLYSLLIASVMLLATLKKGQLGGVLSVFTLSLFGFLISPRTFEMLFDLTRDQMYMANLWAGWISPLQHATYHMHNFGFDALPRLWMTYVIFTVLILAFFTASLITLKRYNFGFTGTDE